MFGRVCSYASEIWILACSLSSLSAGTDVVVTIPDEVVLHGTETPQFPVVM